MAKTLQESLPQELLTKLQKEQYVLVSCLDRETNVPYLSTISWIYAVNEKLLNIAVGYKSHLAQNIETHPHIAIAVIGPETTYAISGKAKIVQPVMDGVKIKVTKIAVEVESVRDIMFYGAKIVTEPAYEKTYDPELAKSIDEAVMAELKKAD